VTNQSEEHKVISAVRPRFEWELEFSSKELGDKIKAAVDDPENTIKARLRDGYATFYFPEEDQHYWSPQLSVSYEDLDQGGSVIRGLYGPRPTVWTMFVFFYSLIIMIIFIISIIGFSRQSLGLPSALLWWNIPLILIFLSLYFVAYSGQRLGRDEMIALHNFLENCLDRK